MKNRCSTICIAGLLFLNPISAAEGQCQLKLAASDPAPANSFGISIAASGDHFVVGSSGDSAYVFGRDKDDNWQEVKKLIVFDAPPISWFGRSVAINGDIIVVGAPSRVYPDEYPGAAYVFARNHGGPDNWGEVKKLTSSDADTGDQFGWSVSVGGDVAVVGAYGNADAGDFTGSAYVFARHEGGTDNWGQVAKLTASDAAAKDRFGWAIYVDGDIVVVGAYFKCSAYLFSGPGWSQVKKLTAPVSSAQFGISVSVSGDIVVVGADSDESGSAFVFGRNKGGADNWGQVKKLTPSDNPPSADFGWSLSLVGDRVVVGTPQSADAGAESGSAYLFDRNEGGADNWGQVAKLTASDAAALDRFGYSVSLDDDLILAGAHGDDDGGSSASSAYAFDALLPDCNRNGICDASDIAQGVSPDCNSNGIPDECDVADGSSNDVNGDGVPDECQPCEVADIDNDGIVGTGDLLILLAQWGPCPPECFGDIDGDGMVGTTDLLMLLAAWGACP